MGGYSFTKSTYTKSNMYIIGSELRYNPKHTANMSVNYSIHKGWLKNTQLGLISSFVGDRFAGRSTRVTILNDNYKLIPLSSYILFDATISYLYKNWSAKGKLANITDVLNYNIHDDNSLNPIAPRNYSLSLSYLF